MKRLIGICLVSGISAAVALYIWPFPKDIRHYSEAELTGLTCEELGARHEEVIFAYHDASLAQYRKTGAFQDDPGLPREDVLPFVILMRKVIQDNKLDGFDTSRPFSHSTRATAPKVHSDFFAEATSVCATTPALDAIEAITQAARNLGLMPAP